MSLHNEAVKKVAIRLYADQVALSLMNSEPRYSIDLCTGTPWRFLQYPDATSIPRTGTILWRFIKTADKITIHCNGVKVLDYWFAESSYKSTCMETWAVQSGHRGIAFYGFDKASKRFRGKPFRLITPEFGKARVNSISCPN